MHLFSHVQYELAGQEIESVNNTGIAGMLMERGFGRRKEYIIAKTDPHDSFSFAIELENLFGFCEDYDEGVYGMRHKLTLVGKGIDDATFKVAATAEGKVELSSLGNAACSSK